MLRFHLLFIVVGVVLLFLFSSAFCSGYGGLQLCKLQGNTSSSNWSCEQPCEFCWINCEQFKSKVATYTVNRLHFASFHRQNHMIGPAAVCTIATASAPFVLPNDGALIVVLFGEESIQLKNHWLGHFERTICCAQTCEFLQMTMAPITVRTMIRHTFKTKIRSL